MNGMINNARALLDLLARSAWRDIYVRTREGAIFIAKEGGAENPLRRDRSGTGLAAGSGPGTANRLTIPAPHVASVVSTLPFATEVHEGSVIAWLELLGQVIEVASPKAGRIESVFVADGDLVEYDSPLVTVIASD